MSAPASRSSPTILAELAEVRRHLLEAPPHHGAGLRDALRASQARLERELADARRREARSGG